MRIAQLAPLAESVPPKLYGGTERVVAWLVDQLVGLGHQVTLFASGDSKTKAELHPVWPRALRLGRRGVDPNTACSLLLEAIAKRAGEFDVIHSHVDWLPLPLLSRSKVPFLTTVHGRLDLPGLPDVVRAFSEARFVSNQFIDIVEVPYPAAAAGSMLPNCNRSAFPVEGNRYAPVRFPLDIGESKQNTSQVERTGRLLSSDSRKRREAIAFGHILHSGVMIGELLLPQWLILVGSAFVLLGAVGLLLRRKASEEVPLREAPQRTTNQVDE